MDSLTSQEARQFAIDAYIYGYPLVLMEMTRRAMTNVSVPDPRTQQAPPGQFVHTYAPPTPQFRQVLFPNVDTFYSLAWLDLSAGPMVLHVPNTHGRYYFLQILDAWTDVVATLGKRITGTHAADYAILCPGGIGPLPAALKPIVVPTSLVWIFGRTRANGAADAPMVKAIQDGYHLKPLSAWGRIYTPPQVPADPTVDSQRSPADQVARMNAAAFFTTLATALRVNPPHEADGAMLDKLARLNIVTGNQFDFAALDSERQQALHQAIPAAQERIQAEVGRLGEVANGWVFGLGLGRYRTNYLSRAANAWCGLEADLAADAFCSYTEVDGAGKRLNGSHNYVLHFPSRRTPPVSGFWSLTMYGLERFLVDNPIGRYAISNRDALRFNTDGTLDIYIQHNSPCPEKQANWLPAPAGDFNVILRMYWPKPEALSRAWIPPAIRRI